MNANAGSTGGGTAQAAGGTNIGSGQATGGGEITPAPAPEPSPVPESTPAPQPTPEPTVLCPNGTYPNKPCDYLITGDGVPGNSGVWTTSEQEAIEACEWGFDRNSPWRGMQSFVGMSEWNDGTRYFTVVFY